MEELLDFLEQLPIFANLTAEELEELAVICQIYEFDEGAVIAYQRDVADSMFMVQDGRLYAQRLDKRGVVRESHQYFPNNYFGESWLFTAQTHPATITAASNGRLVVITSQDFLKFLVAHPQILENLEPEEDSDPPTGLSPEGWEEAQKVKGRADRKSSAVDLLPDELVEYQARRSRWYLLLSLFWPMLGLIVLPSLLYTLLASWELLSNTANLAIASFVAFIFLVFVAFQFLDWYNDYFIITNKHLIHHEFNLRNFRISINKIPIKQIQGVEILKPTLIANIFKIGSARVTTSAQTGAILFDNIDDPSLVQKALNNLTSRVKALNEGEAQAIMRQSLESHFEIPPPLREYADAEEKKAAPAAPPSVGQRLKNQLVWRVVEGNTITYRKHIFILVLQVWLPAFVFLVLTGLGYLLARYTHVNDSIIALFTGIAVLIILGWFIWNFENWRNDTFQVSDKFVVDIDRKPFGFGESRKQAAITNIQNVNANRPGLLPSIFNYGFVNIETAGVDTNITFEYVPHPSQIQADIFQKLELNQQQQRKQQGADRREEYAVLLDVWRQAEEQKRIPKRTPRPGEYIENPDPGS